MEHTKGTWRVAPDQELEKYHPYHECRNIMVGNWVIARMTDHRNQRANSRLIAASPALLESCQYVEMASEGIELDGTESDDHALQITITAAGLRDLRAAIAKARRTA
jgi:hypothetical protein